MSTDLDMMSRLALLEARFNALEPEETTTAVSGDTEFTQSTTSTSTGFTEIAPLALTITDDGTWRSFTVAGVPSTATGILLWVEFNNSSGSGTPKRLEARKASGANEYKLVSSASGAGSDTTAAGVQAFAPVGGTFEYKADSGWITLIECHGYYS